MTLTIENVTDKLEAEGWTKCKGGFKAFAYWAKRFPSRQLCRFNADKPGIQIIINHYKGETINGRDIPDGFDMELYGEKPDGVWVALTVYSLSNVEQLDSQVAQLIKAWETMCDNSEILEIE